MEKGQAKEDNKGIEFLDISLSLPGASPSLQQIPIMDKEGNLVQPAKIDLLARTDKGQGGKQSISEAHDID